MKHASLKLAIFTVWMMFNICAVVWLILGEMFGAAMSVVCGAAFWEITGPIFRKKT